MGVPHALPGGRVLAYPASLQREVAESPLAESITLQLLTREEAGEALRCESSREGARARGGRGDRATLASRQGRGR